MCDLESWCYTLHLIVLWIDQCALQLPISSVGAFVFEFVMLKLCATICMGLCCGLHSGSCSCPCIQLGHVFVYVSRMLMCALVPAVVDLYSFVEVVVHVFVKAHAFENLVVYVDTCAAVLPHVRNAPSLSGRNKSDRLFSTTDQVTSAGK